MLLQKLKMETVKLWKCKIIIFGFQVEKGDFNKPKSWRIHFLESGYGAIHSVTSFMNGP